MSKLRTNELESLESGRSLKVDEMAQTFDYVAGIEITSYNQLVRDNTGKLWRASGTTELPYTLTGVGGNEGGALIGAGDSTLRSELASPVSSGGGAVLIAGATVSVASIGELSTILTPTEGMAVHVKSFHPDTLNGGGMFVYDAAAAKSEHNGGTVVSNTVPYTADVGVYLSGALDTDAEGFGVFRRVFSGEAMASWYGASTEIVDNTPSINTAIELHSTVKVDVQGILNFTKPIVVYSGTKLYGLGKGVTVLMKSGNVSSGLASIEERFGTGSGVYDVDACLIIHEGKILPNEPISHTNAMYIDISDIGFNRVNLGTGYGLYGSSVSLSKFSNIYIRNSKVGVRFFSCWMAEWSRVEARGNQQIGFHLGNPVTTGTSNTFTSCWSAGIGQTADTQDNSAAYLLRNFIYTNLISSGADFVGTATVPSRVYDLQGFTGSLIGCGAEVIHGSFAVVHESKCTFTNPSSYQFFGDVSGYPVFDVKSNSTVVLENPNISMAKAVDGPITSKYFKVTYGSDLFVTGGVYTPRIQTITEFYEAVLSTQNSAINANIPYLGQVNISAQRGKNVQKLSVDGHIGTESGLGKWDSGHLMLGSYHLWVDAAGRLKIKAGAPKSDEDGAIVGTQVV